MAKAPRVLFYDIETAGVNARHADLGFIIIFGYKWDDGPVKSIVIGRKQLGRFDDSKLLQKVRKILSHADITVGHYASVFDRRFINGRLLINRMSPTDKSVLRDTVFAYRRAANFSSNRLLHLAKILESRHRKLENHWPKAWFQVMRGNIGALKGMAKYCFVPDHKLLGQDLCWKAAGNFKVGEVVLGFDEDGPHRRYRASRIEAISYANEPVFNVQLASDKIFSVTKEHRWLTAHKNPFGQVGTFKWIETQNLAYPGRWGNGVTTVPKLLNEWTEDFSKETGWLAGIYDGEGSIGWAFQRKQGDRSPGGLHISIGQNPGPTLEKIVSLTKKYLPNSTLRQTNSNRKCQTLNINGNLFEKIEFLGKVRPERLIEKIDFNNLGRVEARNSLEDIKGIYPIGNRDIIKIQTSTGTLVVDGYPMHNCEGDVLAVEELYYKVKPFVKSWNEKEKGK